MTAYRKIMLRYGLAALLIVSGLIVLGGGVYLLVHGGSWFYAVSGSLTTVVGVLLWRDCRRAAARIYGALLFATFLWALWETGGGGWALLPRVGVPTLFYVGLLVSGIARREPSTFISRRAARAGAVALLALATIGLAAGGILSVWNAGSESYLAFSQPLSVTNDSAEDWSEYGYSKAGTRFSPLTQVTPENVSELEVAWTYRLGPPDGVGTGRLQTTPIKVGDSLYLCSSYNDVVALDTETGKERWRFSAKLDPRTVAGARCRGVAYYRLPGTDGHCSERVFSATVDARLIALDARDGTLCRDFGNRGIVTLLAGMGDGAIQDYSVSSAPIVVRGRIVVGGGVRDNEFWGEPSGVIRAFDAVNGRLAWAFDTGRPAEHGEQEADKTYTRSTPNSWAPMSADEVLGFVYAPIGNATPDYYGGQRRTFDDELSSSIVAIDAETGDLRWSFQTTHHDLWDYDVASQPTLIDISGPAGVQHALIQATKRGELFLLDRVTGRPLAEVTERSVPQNGIVSGERLAPTQPFSTGMPSLSGPPLTEAMMWGISTFDHLWCRIKFRQARYEGPLTPPGLQPSITYPGYLGGMNWGGVSVDSTRMVLIASTNYIASYTWLVPRARADSAEGTAIAERASARGLNWSPQRNTPYAVVTGFFISPLGLPCTQPPFGKISAIDLTSRKLLWSRRLGSARDSQIFDVPLSVPIPMGVANVGGAITTASGLTFIAATQERSIRAFDTRTGERLWSARLPAGGHATPMTYFSPKSERQFVVIAAGGSPYLKSGTGDYIIAFSLPKLL